MSTPTTWAAVRSGWSRGSTLHWTPANLSKFPDSAQVSSWAKEAMQDAVALGLINGTKAPDGLVYIDPQGSATRQQVATILMNFCQKVKK